MCERWRYSFPYFLEDMGEKPDGYEIDRINNDGNYEPSNCRWATRQQQIDNMRMKMILPKDDMTNIVEYATCWMYHTRITCKSINHKIQYRETFDTYEEARELRDMVVYEKMFHRQLGMR